MKRQSIITITLVFMLILITLSISTTAFALTGDNRPLQQSGLPSIIFLGEGPQTFSVEAPREFLVKTYRNGSFLFETDEGPTYTAVRGERVWTTDFVPAEPIRLFHESKNYGNYTAGCVVNYVQIEDNLDTRRNTFYINGKVLQVVEQGMVTYGTFTIPEDGELTFYAEDSIGMIVQTCQTSQTSAPSQTPPVITTTATAEPSATGTVEVSTATPTTAAPTASPTVGPSATQPATGSSPTPTATNTSTRPPTAVVIIPSQTPTLSPSATATRRPDNSTSEPSSTPVTVIITVPPGPSATPRPTSTPQVIYITATPIGTPGAIPITGGGPGPREVAAISAAILGLFGLIAAAWWFLLRAYQNGR